MDAGMCNPSISYDPWFSHLVDDHTSTGRRHHLDLHIAGQGSHAAEGLETLAVDRAATRLDVFAHREEIAGLARCHEVKRALFVRAFGKRCKGDNVNDKY